MITFYSSFRFGLLEFDHFLFCFGYDRGNYHKLCLLLSNFCFFWFRHIDNMPKSWKWSVWVCTMPVHHCWQYLVVRCSSLSRLCEKVAFLLYYSMPVSIKAVRSSTWRRAPLIRHRHKLMNAWNSQVTKAPLTSYHIQHNGKDLCGESYNKIVVLMYLLS